MKYIAFWKIMEAGTSGVIIERNVWTHSNSAGTTKVVHEIVFQNASVKEALKESQPSSKHK